MKGFYNENGKKELLVDQLIYQINIPSTTQSFLANKSKLRKINAQYTYQYPKN